MVHLRTARSHVVSSTDIQLMKPAALQSDSSDSPRDVSQRHSRVQLQRQHSCGIKGLGQQESDYEHSPVVQVDHETRRYSRLHKNNGSRLLNMRLNETQTHSYPAHSVNKSTFAAVELVNLTKRLEMW